MIELTRRTLLASTVAATAVAAAPLATGRSGHAAAPPPARRPRAGTATKSVASRSPW
jgi:hypothetical protein